MPATLKSLEMSQAPLLENGDRLSRTEFERRYAAMPANIKAELIEGVVYMASAVQARSHGLPHGVLVDELRYTARHTPGVFLATMLLCAWI